MSKNDRDEITRWVQRLNKLGAEMDEWAASMHPSAWHEEFAAQRDKWKRIAQSLPEDKPQPQITVCRYDGADLRDHVEQYHYLHRWPDPRSLPFGYVLAVDGNRYCRDGRLAGLVVFKKPQHHKQHGLFGYPDLPTSWQVLDLARVWIHPDLQKRGMNMFSRMVGRAIRRVQWDWLEHHPPVFPHLPYHITLIISYCELAHHDGTAYRASGFTRFGLSSDGKKEVYIRRLAAPLKSWTPQGPVQWSMFSDVPLIHV